MVAAFTFTYNVGVGTIITSGAVALVGYLLNRKTKQIHVLVNSQMSTALKRISELEAKLSLGPGEQIPTASVVTISGSGDPPLLHEEETGRNVG
jgi:hypothetical protein